MEDKEFRESLTDAEREFYDQCYKEESKKYEKILSEMRKDLEAAQKESEEMERSLEKTNAETNFYQNKLDTIKCLFSNDLGLTQEESYQLIGQILRSDKLVRIVKDPITGKGKIEEY